MFPQSFTKNTGLPFYNYDQRGLLRNLTAQNGNQVLVDGLGMFVFYAGDPVQQTRVNATTPFVDDDESCFLTQGGAWVLEYPHWDLINNWNLPDLEDLNAVVFSRINGGPRLLYATTVGNTISSLSSNATANISVRFNDAQIGDVVVVSPSRTPTTGGRVAIYGYVLGQNLVSIEINNPSASTATFVSGLAFNVIVIKQS